MPTSGLELADVIFASTLVFCCTNMPTSYYGCPSEGKIFTFLLPWNLVTRRGKVNINYKLYIIVHYLQIR
jgi:hypothetical protein